MRAAIPVKDIADARPDEDVLSLEDLQAQPDSIVGEMGAGAETVGAA